jgi:hypothetical protein
MFVVRGRGKVLFSVDALQVMTNSHCGYEAVKSRRLSLRLWSHHHECALKLLRKFKKRYEIVVGCVLEVSKMLGAAPVEEIRA